MRTGYRWLISAAPAVLAVLVTPVAAFAESYEVRVAGAEVYATSTEGRFVGTASGHLPGDWYIDVLHEPLTGDPSTPSAITGGTFDLATTLQGQPALVLGRFEPYGGSVVQLDGFDTCTPTQNFAVTGELVDVGVYGGARVGSGHFMATLTHYRYWFFGRCLSYWASVSGTVLLDF